jgi:hypothetical protein
MAMQGLVAYVYDELLPGTWMELNQCRFNHMGTYRRMDACGLRWAFICVAVCSPPPTHAAAAPIIMNDEPYTMTIYIYLCIYYIGMDTLYRNPPAFNKRHHKAGKCRNDLDYCEDCMSTASELIYSVHYTQCRKPFQCITNGEKEYGRSKVTIPEGQVLLDHCMELQGRWHDLRTDLEDQLLELTHDETIREGQSGNHMKEIFHGHCTKSNGYLFMTGTKETFKRIGELY